MKNKARIKIIRKSELSSRKKRKRAGARRNRNVKSMTVANVSNWVNDFQKRKRTETKKALKILLPNGPQTDSA